MWCILLCRSLFLCRVLSSLLFWSRDISDTFELFKDSLNALLSLHSFFSDAFFRLLLRFFSRCFSSLGVLLLSSMSLRISASLSRNSSLSFAAADVATCASLLSLLNSFALLLEWNAIEPASSTWCGTCAPRCSSELCSGCPPPSGRSFDSRSRAIKSQPLLEPCPVSISCASSSSSIFTSGCGRWFCSRSPVILSRSLPCFPSSLPRSVDVHPSWRLCSCWSIPPRWFATLLLQFMLLLSISWATASTSVLSASAAAFSLSTWSFALFPVSCTSLPFQAAAFC